MTSSLRSRLRSDDVIGVLAVVAVDNLGLLSVPPFNARATLDETGLPLSSWSKSRRFLGELNPLFLAGLLPAFACASLIRCLNLRALLLALAADVGPPGVDLDSLGVDPAAGGAILDTTAGSDSSPPPPSSS